MEQVEIFNYIRENKRYIDNIGTTAEGMPLIWFDCLDLPEEVSKGQLVRDAPETIILRFKPDANGRGVLDSVETNMKRRLIANNGMVLLDTATPLGMQANRPDKLSFVSLFWGAASRFIANGRVRKMLGFNYLPLFDSSGAVTVLTAEQEAAAPTFDYETHKADGTPIPANEDTPHP
jgi:hypothetical protein